MTNKHIKEISKLRQSVSRIPDKITALPEQTEFYKLMEQIQRRKAELFSDIKMLEQ